MELITENNYIVIQGFMRTELDLKGNELMAFALIYGFSQIMDQNFTGSLTYISEWLGCSRPTTINILNGLIEKGLIEKEERVINRVKFVSYGVVKKFNHPLKNLTSSKKTLLNNINNINKNNNINNYCNTNIDIKDKNYCNININKEKEIKEKEYGFSEELNSALETWFNYKKQKGQTYKEIGRKTFLTTIQHDVEKFGERAVILSLEKSMASNWAGYFMDGKIAQQNPKEIKYDKNDTGEFW